jgi:hypothetical protein
VLSASSGGDGAMGGSLVEGLETAVTKLVDEAF